ncbi:hypothetical protein PN471_14995 [Aphanizomenon sp. CS-733/32]|uniref:hypothetical protein n=1 Tax=Aphanizomenon sp. CS-733/32 TaxID=3021715 RepID=UPI00232BDD93|nr:hypothetical protein [Aphanizomenon sp. CS-733/32]MDB9309918.1 hypothetical protein [Aphanizomenon sp. CS-733/32]
MTKTQHLVKLSSVEDDGLGEELQVIWELEVGARIYEKMELPQPKGFDSPERLDAFLDAVRWGAASTADIRTVQSPFRSGIDIEDYQLDPVVRAIQMPRVNLLIADDVGLGKTIEAGLVAQELIIRHRCHRIVIVYIYLGKTSYIKTLWLIKFILLILQKLVIKMGFVSRNLFLKIIPI